MSEPLDLNAQTITVTLGGKSYDLDFVQCRLVLEDLEDKYTPETQDKVEPGKFTELLTEFAAWLISAYGLAVNNGQAWTIRHGVLKAFNDFKKKCDDELSSDTPST